MRIWRLTDAEYAESAFSGLGAETYGGRFNSVGRRLVYAAGSLSLAMLELLVQANDRARLRNHVYLSAECPEEQVSYVSIEALPGDWNALPYRSSSQRFGDAWIDRQESLVLGVPSVIVPEEWNFLVNPAHPAFGGITVSEPRRAAFDPRLLR